MFKISPDKSMDSLKRTLKMELDSETSDTKNSDYRLNKANIKEIFVTAHENINKTENNSFAKMPDLANSKDVCRIEDSPYYIHRLAQTNKRLNEFKNVYYANPLVLSLKDEVKRWLPIHYAAFNSNIKTIEFILEKSDKNMINAVDDNGNTPLHIAIQNGSIECCKFLLDKGANIKIMNKDGQTAIHYCIVKGKILILEFILTNAQQVDPNIPDKNGTSPLHYCTLFDDADCAKLLLKHGADMFKTCNHGSLPIHVAASLRSNKVMEFLIEESKKRGLCKKGLFSFGDADKNKPLHNAVQFGNLDTVRIFLENGANITDKNDVDQSTAVHIACGQGSLEMVKLMFEKQPNLVLEALNMTDINLMTPLHRAAMFDHEDLVAYLLEHDADIEARDKEKRTPLLLACSRHSMKVLCYLLKNRNPNINVKDCKKRNLLHLMLSLDANNSIFKRHSSSSKSRPSSSTSDRKINESKENNISYSFQEVINELIKNPDFAELLSEQDAEGCTIMHYASKLGYTTCIRSLMEFGAATCIKNNEKQSALHFAAKYGRFNSCLQILSTPKYKNYINEKDFNGCTPLHLAAQNGHDSVVRLLMSKGALTYKSYSGNTPFHEAAANGYVNCMSILYNVDTNILNLTNKNEDTALHVAAKEGHPNASNAVEYLLNIGAALLKNSEGLTFIDIAIREKHEGVLLTVIAHERWSEVFDLSSKMYKTPLMGIIEFSSEVTQAVLERCVVRKDSEKHNGKEYTVYREVNPLF